jgi:hypothetical protein
MDKAVVLPLLLQPSSFSEYPMRSSSQVTMVTTPCATTSTSAPWCQTIRSQCWCVSCGLEPGPSGAKPRAISLSRWLRSYRLLCSPTTRSTW